MVGTKEWKEVIKFEKITEKTVDPNYEGSQQGINRSSGKQIEQQSMGSSSGRDSKSPLFQGKMQKAALHSLIQTMAEKFDYDPAVIQRTRNSIIFNTELENLHSDFDDHFKNLRRQSLILSSLKQNIKNAIEENQPGRDRSSSNSPTFSKSDISKIETRNQRNKPIVSKEELAGSKEQNLNLNIPVEQLSDDMLRQISGHLSKFSAGEEGKSNMTEENK